MNTHYLQQMPSEWEPIARIFAALGDGTRQTIMLLFEPGEEIGLKQMAETLPLSRTAVVHHLAVLEQAGLISARKQGREVFYTRNLAFLINALDSVRLYAQENLPGAETSPA